MSATDGTSSIPCFLLLLFGRRSPPFFVWKVLCGKFCGRVEERRVAGVLGESLSYFATCSFLVPLSKLQRLSSQLSSQAEWVWGSFLEQKKKKKNTFFFQEKSPNYLLMLPFFLLRVLPFLLWEGGCSPATRLDQLFLIQRRYTHSGRVPPPDKTQPSR